MHPERKRYAIVRDVPRSFDRCLKNPQFVDQPIDLELARRQHRAYCAALAEADLELISLPADDRFPDCCFVEDTALVVGGTAVMLHMGAASRVGEEVAVREALSRYLTVVELKPPHTVDGGDVLTCGRQVFVGRTSRTSRAGRRSLREALTPLDHEVTPEPVSDVLHLKSSCSLLPDGALLIVPAHFPADAFADFERVVVAREDAYSANCLAVNGQVLMSSGFDRTREMLAARGLPPVELDMSEFRKANGSLTCLSILF